MKRLSISLVAASLALAGCTPLTVARGPSDPPPTGIVATADRVVLTGERGFAVAELAYITAADGVGRLADNGVITGATATQVRAWNAQARALLVKGKATADAAEKASAAADLFGIADRLNSLIGSK